MHTYSFAHTVLLAVAWRPGWTWTGWDYKGEPTPYGWPDINSHFGIIDEAGFPKDRFYWYQAWFGTADPVVLHVFPHWNWAEGQKVRMEVKLYQSRTFSPPPPPPSTHTHTHTHARARALLNQRVHS
jgi:hypothetical protein